LVSLSFVPYTPHAKSTEAASDIGPTSAVLNGTLTGLSGGAVVSISFEYGVTTSYGNCTAGQSLTESGPFSASINMLKSDTVYHFRVKVEGLSDYYGEDMTFKTTHYAVFAIYLAECLAGDPSYYAWDLTSTFYLTF
jgi:hypothetical protein